MTAAKRTTKSKKRYFIVNPAGAIHEVTYEHAKMRLKEGKFRMANKAEVKAYMDAGGNQSAGAPLAEKFSDEPEPIEPDEAAEVKREK